MNSITQAQWQAVEAAVRAVPDPEIPVITLDDLGVIRQVEREEDEAGRPVLAVTLTPTYSGCPAMEAMVAAVREVGEHAGIPVIVHARLAPAWTTDWLSPQGRDALRRFGIAPPAGTAAQAPVSLTLQRHIVRCPQCGSSETEEVSRFGSTACKALRRCLDCREPFEEFKTI